MTQPSGFDVLAPTGLVTGDREPAVQINRVHWPVTALGPGERVGIWFQGCSIRCKGCCSQDTWPADTRMAVPISEVLGWVRSLDPTRIAGFTISGGEPFDQPLPLLALLKGLRSLGFHGPAHSVIVYSGYRWRHLQKCYPELLQWLDLLISEPYVAKLPGDRRLGSSNQKCHQISELGRATWDLWERSETPPIQLFVDAGVIWMVGVPLAGDMDVLEGRLAAAGVDIAAASWRS